MLKKYKPEKEGCIPIIVSQDGGSNTPKHIAHNINRNPIRHYRIDGYVIQSASSRKCDYLLLNDEKKDAYLIELKGSKVLHALQQIEETEKLLKEDLKGYAIKRRVVTNNRISNTMTKDIAKYKLRWKDTLQVSTKVMEESI